MTRNRRSEHVFGASGWYPDNAASTANEAARERRKTLTGPGRPALRRVIDQ